MAHSCIGASTWSSRSSSRPTIARTNCARPSAASRSSTSTATGNSWSSTTSRPDHTRAVVEEESASFPGSAALSVRAGAGALRGAQHRHPCGEGQDHRDDRRRCAGRARLADARRRRARGARLRLRRRQSLADLERAAARLAARSARRGTGPCWRCRTTVTSRWSSA